MVLRMTPTISPGVTRAVATKSGRSLLIPRVAMPSSSIAPCALQRRVHPRQTSRHGDLSGSGRSLMPANGRSATVESERERFDRRRSLIDPNPPPAIFWPSDRCTL